MKGRKVSSQRIAELKKSSLKEAKKNNGIDLMALDLTNHFINETIKYKKQAKQFNRKETPINQESIQWKEFLGWADLNKDLIKQKSKSPKRGWRADLYQSASKSLDLPLPTFYRHLKKYLKENIR
jgi:hypothetical protein